ncbi:MAG: alpha/beta hydrolase [Ascidiaceihabitans sp.]|jgi:lysophospholipase|nr:alpha/beta hydrolase [Ascidiaceihabitans sp.]
MTLTAAPFYSDVCPAGENAKAYWAHTSDNKRIRLAVWAENAARGTVLLFPGRTEYVEKYAAYAADLESRGYCTIAADWRGQGLADRLLDDPMVGHVERFHDYQKDVEALVSAATELDLPKPYYLMAHSMGGAIGLRALANGLAVKAAVFSAPMWGIHLAPHLRPAAWILSHVMPILGKGASHPPNTSPESYVLTADFEDNMLTSDPQMFELMTDQVAKYNALGLGGPSYVWLREALKETRSLAALRSPKVPTLTFLGTNERIVRVSSVHNRMRRWGNGDLELVQDAEHEILMEQQSIRDSALDQIAALFTDHS